MIGAMLLILTLAGTPENVRVSIDTDSARAVLSLLDRQPGSKLDEDAWSRLLESEGYRRLKKREASMGRAFEDQEFKDFVLSEKLRSRRQALSHTLNGWSSVDVAASARRALRYLPAGTELKATIYPMIKPRENSFVFELSSTHPGIFFFLDPNQSPEVFENTLTHELHHVGLSSACATVESPALNGPQSEVAKWIGAFGEGFAMLAAAGDVNTHPHAMSPAEDRERWNRDVAQFDRDLKRIERFFTTILAGGFADAQEQTQVARSFYGIQGPWYTVGWRMAMQIETVLGRDRLISVLCRPVDFLRAYNEAAPEGAARWSDSLLSQLRPE